MHNVLSNSARGALRTKAGGSGDIETLVLDELTKRDSEIKAFAEGAVKKMEALSDRLGDLEQKSHRRGGSGSGSQGEPTELAAQFTKSAQFDALKAGASSTGRVTIDNVSIKAITNAGAGVTGSTDYMGQVQRQAGLYNDPRRKLSLLDVLPSLPVTAAVFEYMQLTGYTNAAAEQEKEGAQKAEADIHAVPTQSQIATVAHWIKASKQVLDDTPALGQQIGNLMNYGLLAKLESLLIGGVGGQGKIKGLIGFATAFDRSAAPTGSNKADIIGLAVTSLNAKGWNAGLIVMNPEDWFAVSSMKDVDGDYLMGSPRDPAPPAMWNVPVIVSASLAKGTALVLDPAQTAILDREQPSLMASREDANNFTSNLVTLLAELRAGLAVFSVGAVLKVDITG